MSGENSDTEVTENTEVEIGEESEVEKDIILTVQARTFNDNNEEYKTLLSYIKPYSKYNGTQGDKKSNIIIPDRYSGFIPKDKIIGLLKLLEACRNNKCNIPISEARYTVDAEYSGIMIDLDMKLSDTKRIKEFDHGMPKLVLNIMQIIHSYVESGLEGSYEVLIERKPEPKKIDEEKSYYKMGYHIIIPEVLIPKVQQKYLMEQLIDRCVCHKMFKEAFLNNDVLDPASYRVPVFFPGFPSKIGKPAYILYKFLKIEVVDGQFSSNTIDYSETSKHFNACGKFCLGMGLTTEFKMNRRKYNLKPEYMKYIQSLINTYTQNTEEELEELIGNDIEAKELHKILGMINFSKISNYDTWTKIIWTIGNISSRYEPLARWVSKRTPDKFDENTFMNIWKSGLANKRSGKPGPDIKYLRSIAQSDSPVEYEKAKAENILEELISNVTRVGIREYDVSMILGSVFSDKYVINSDSMVDRRPKWYQFRTPIDNPDQGELYKWREVQIYPPPAIIKYMGRDLTNILYSYDKIIIKQMSALQPTDEKHKNLKEIRNKIKTGIQKLGSSNFMEGSLKSTSATGIRVLRSKEFDKDPRTFGVGNGILFFEVGKLPKLISEYNNFMVTKTSKYNWTIFDPKNNSKHRKVLVDFRIRYPWDEPDTFIWKMIHYAFCLTGFRKPTILITCTGAGKNGKSEELEAVLDALGDYATTVPSTFFTEEDGKTDSPSPTGLDQFGKNLIGCSETSKDVYLKEKVVKKITGADSQKFRNLFSGVLVNGIINALYFIVSNYPFMIQDTAYSIWRRVVFHIYKVIFLDPENNPKDKAMYDRNNPNHINISDINKLYGPYKRHKDDPELLEAVLSMLVHYYSVFVLKYGSDLSKVSKPHIDYETRRFEMQQNSLLKFLTNRLVKVRVADDEKKPEDMLLNVKEIAAAYVKEMHDRKVSVNIDTTTSEIIEMPELKPYIYTDEQTGLHSLKNCKLMKTEGRYSEGESAIFAKNDKELENEYKSRFEMVGSETLDSFLDNVYADVDMINKFYKLETEINKSKAEEYYREIRESMEVKFEAERKLIEMAKKERGKKEIKVEKTYVNERKSTTNKPLGKLKVSPDD